MKTSLKPTENCTVRRKAKKVAFDAQEKKFDYK